MALSGRKPKPEGQKRNRVKSAFDWVEVEDVPYAGDCPTLGRAPRATREWWAHVTTMPHCILWTPGDWQFAVDTARVHAAFVRGDLARASELRRRENQMGTTLDARRDLRIRYVRRDLEEEEVPGVTSLADYRASLE